MNKFFIKLFFIFTIFKLAFATNMTLVDVFMINIKTFYYSYNFVVYIAMLIGVILVIHSGVMIYNKSQNQQIRNSGIITRLIIGGLLTSITVFIAIWSSGVFGYSKAEDGYRKMLDESMGKAARVKDYKTANSHCNKTNCEKY